MRSVTIAIVVGLAFVCATGASANVAGGAGATTAVETPPVAHCPSGSVLCGKTCIAKACPTKPPRSASCYHVMCPMFVRQCPAGTAWGRRSPTDCCNDACVKDH
jgi:hypothetical protein